MFKKTLFSLALFLNMTVHAAQQPNHPVYYIGNLTLTGRFALAAIMQYKPDLARTIPHLVDELTRNPLQPAEQKELDTLLKNAFPKKTSSFTKTIADIMAAAHELVPHLKALIPAAPSL